MYYTYMLRCADNSIYTGITTDLERRFREHAGLKKGGAKYTRSRSPVKIEAAWSSENRITASKLEYEIKHLTKGKKELIASSKELFCDIMDGKIDVDKYLPVELNLL